MIIYGTRATHLRTAQIKEKCPNCQNSNTVIMSVYQQYAHIFWIPTFPLNKIGVSECQHCKQTLEHKQFNTEFKYEYDVLKTAASTPIWTFAGGIIIAGLIAYGVVASSISTEDEKKNIASPKVNDVYEVKQDGAYTLQKVVKVDKDSVWIYMNNYQIDKLSGISKIYAQGDTAYLPIPIPFAISELKAKYESGEIVNVKRNE